MSKQTHAQGHAQSHDGGSEKSKEASAGEQKKAGHSVDHKGDHKADHADPKAEHKTDHKKGDVVSIGQKGKGHNPMPGGCFAWGCKAQAARFNFCEEHFEHFKFGLIQKTGEPVSDYEKKIEHFHAYQAKRKALKAA